MIRSKSVIAEKASNSRLSRLVLVLNSDFWNFHAAWFRFVDGSMETLSQRSHKHMLYELHYVLSGRLTFILSHDRVFQVPAGSFIIVPPQAMHRIVDEQPPSAKLVCGFSVSSANAWVQSCLAGVQDNPRRLQGSAALRQLIAALQSKLEAALPSSNLFSLFIAQSILLESLEIIQPKSVSIPENTLKTSAEDQRMEEAQRFIRENIQSKITGRDVAEHLHISPRHLNRLCNANFNCSIHRLIAQENAQWAQRLIEETALSLTDISEMIGYANVYAFIRAFKNVTGVSPGAYAKDIQRR